MGIVRVKTASERLKKLVSDTNSEKNRDEEKTGQSETLAPSNQDALVASSNDLFSE
jgi:hypothetical protein